MTVMVSLFSPAEISIAPPPVTEAVATAGIAVRLTVVVPVEPEVHNG
jgi:hypothetical protein